MREKKNWERKNVDRKKSSTHLALNQQKVRMVMEHLNEMKKKWCAFLQMCPFRPYVV